MTTGLVHYALENLEREPAEAEDVGRDQFCTVLHLALPHSKGPRKKISAPGRSGAGAGVRADLHELWGGELHRGHARSREAVANHLKVDRCRKVLLACQRQREAETAELPVPVAGDVDILRRNTQMGDLEPTMVAEFDRLADLPQAIFYLPHGQLSTPRTPMLVARLCPRVVATSGIAGTYCASSGPGLGRLWKISSALPSDPMMGSVTMTIAARDSSSGSTTLRKLGCRIRDRVWI